MDIEVLTDQLLRIRESGSAYRFIEQAHRVLAAVPFAPRLALLTLESLIDLGLCGPARELLQLRRDLPAEHAQVGRLTAACARGPNGRVPWTDLQARFQRNVAVLLNHRPQLDPLVRTARTALQEVQLYQTRDGALQISSREPGALRRWWPPLTQSAADVSVALPPHGKLGAVVVIGARMGPLLERVYRDTRRLLLTYSHPVYLVEPDPVYFAAWLHGAGLESMLDDERLQCLVGPGALDELEQRLVDEPGLVIPEFCVNQTADPELTGRAIRSAERASQRRAAALARLVDELRRRYEGRDAAYWAGRWRSPGTVLAITSRFTTVLQYSTRDALRALESQGYATRRVIESCDHHQLSSLDVCRAILEHDPSLMLVLDHLRYEYPHVPANLPFLAWIQDPMPNLLCRHAGESVGPFDFVCGYYRDRCITEFGYPPDAFAYADIPVSTDIFHDGELDPETRRRYACDVSFASNGSTPIERLHQLESADLPAPLRPMLDAIYQRVLALLGRDEYPRLSDAARELVQEAAAEHRVPLTPAQVESLTVNYAYRLLDWGRRQQTLEWAAAWARRTGRTLRIYGRGWDQHPTLAAFAAGTLEHGEPLRAAYRASRLALQLIPSGFWHQRSYELLAAGTLPLSRHCPDDFDFLPMDEFIRRREAGERIGGAAATFPRLERIVFRTAAEFEALAERFLADPEYYQTVRHELREVVLREYTYDAVVRRVMGTFRERIEAQARPAALAHAGPPAVPDVSSLSSALIGQSRLAVTRQTRSASPLSS